MVQVEGMWLKKPHFSCVFLVYKFDFPASYFFRETAEADEAPRSEKKTLIVAFLSSPLSPRTGFFASLKLCEF